jgi:hypothetical protein
MPFAWATCPLYALNGKLDTSQRTLSLYRIDPSKFADADIVKLLPEVKRFDKDNRFARIPGYFSFRLERVQEVAASELRVFRVHQNETADTLLPWPQITDANMCQKRSVPMQDNILYG